MKTHLGLAILLEINGQQIPAIFEVGLRMTELYSKLLHESVISQFCEDLTDVLSTNRMAKADENSSCCPSSSRWRAALSGAQCDATPKRAPKRRSFEWFQKALNVSQAFGVRVLLSLTFLFHILPCILGGLGSNFGFARSQCVCGCAFLIMQNCVRCLLSISQLLFQACLPFDAYLVASPVCEVLIVFHSILVSVDGILETEDVAILCATCQNLAERTMCQQTLTRSWGELVTR